MKNTIRLILSVWMLSATAAFAQKGVFFSEYGEGTSSNKYLEVYNGSGADINLKQFGIRTASNGGGWQSSLVRFNGADSILKAGSPCIGKGTKQWGPVQVQWNATGDLAPSIMQPSTDIGAYPTDNSGNQYF